MCTSTENVWHEPPEELTLGGEVHVWRVSLDQSQSELENLQSLLSAEERARASRYYFERDRRRFVAARGSLRLILSRYTGIPAAQMTFFSGVRGKPNLAPPPGGPTVRFNLSHSAGIALYAIAQRYELGIDVERVWPDVAVHEIAQRFFSPSEYAAICAQPPHLQGAAFYAFWTLKEAYIKATGEGLWIPLNYFEVKLQQDESVLVSTSADARAPTRWRLKKLQVDPSYAAALAVEGHDWELKCWSRQ